MKLWAIFIKSIREQSRQFWLLLLTVLMAPFFVGVYYLMWESTQLKLDIALVNLDASSGESQFGQEFSNWTLSNQPDSIPIRFHESRGRAEALKSLESKTADALLILPADFSEKMAELKAGLAVKVPFELSGDLTDPNYLFAAIWAHELIVDYIQETTGVALFYEFTETPAGWSGSMGEFELYVPGLLILSTIMLLFTAAIAFVREAEQQTILRLKLSRVSHFELIGGISAVQVLIGMISIGATLLLARALGFDFRGSWTLFLAIGVLVCISMIGFSLILAALTTSVNQILIVGNFPLFLFMFFTGAMMPVHGPTLFHFAGYDFTLPGLMSPYHAVEAIREVSIFGAGWKDIWPEMASLLGVSIIYFTIGGILFRNRHLKLK